MLYVDFFHLIIFPSLSLHYTRFAFLINTLRGINSIQNKENKVTSRYLFFIPLNMYNTSYIAVFEVWYILVGMTSYMER